MIWSRQEIRNPNPKRNNKLKEFKNIKCIEIVLLDKFQKCDTIVSVKE